MKSDVEGKIIESLSMQSGTSLNGKEWQKKTLVIETDEDGFSKNLAIDFWSEVASKANDELKIGDICVFSCEAKSNQYKTAWYTNIGCWKFKKTKDAELEETQIQTEMETEIKSDDLPF